MSSDELIGKSLGQYQIRVRLGRGGMSTVYLAYQPSMDRTVAIKVLPREFLHDPTFLARFQQEGRTIAKLEHLHILPVYDFGEENGIPYIVMRYLPGGTLADLIADRLPPVATTVHIVEQVADALDYAHERGIIHRDLKPSNVLLDSGGNAYLADFGIARVVQAAQAANLTGSRVLGTPPYVAPEMVKKDQTVTGSVDIYALGIITFEMLTGQVPFYDEDPMKTLMAHVLEPVPSMRQLDPHIRPEIDAVVMRCLAKTPQQRHKTAAEYASALAHAAQPASRDRRARPPKPAKSPDTPIRPHEQTQTTPAHGTESPRQGRRGWLIGLVSIAALLLGLALVGYGVIGGDTARLEALLYMPTGTTTPTATLTPTPGGPPTTPLPRILPPPGGGDRLLFASDRDGDFELYLIDLDGSNLRQVTDNSGPDFDPVWSPDGTQIAYAASSGDDDAEIRVVRLECVARRQSCDEASRPLTDNDASDLGPAWSPDGTRIAFASNRDGDYEIYTMAADGSDVRQLTFNDVDDSAPGWSPDGRQIVYHVQEDNISDLYEIDSTGGVPRRLTNQTGLNLWPDWSPAPSGGGADDGLIAFTSTDDLSAGSAIFALDLATDSIVRLTSGPGHDDDPAWSPDGTRIAFDSDRDGDGHFHLFVLDVATGALLRLTSEAADDVSPAWQPQP